MSGTNPLKEYFRQPSLYLKLPTLGKWYSPQQVELVNQTEIPIFGMTAIDEILLNTPDAMLSGQALEKVVQHCAPSVRDVKNLLIPDLEAIFLGMKIATSEGKYDITRSCPKCNHENNFELNCQILLDQVSYIEDSDTVLNFNDNLVVSVRPYTLEMRQLFIQREYEEEMLLKQVDQNNTTISEIEKAKVLAESIERLSKITFDLVSKSIVSIRIIQQNLTVTDPSHIAEWLSGISKVQADLVTNAINNLNNIGVPKKIDAVCENCNHSWEENISFDPVSFFAQR